MNYNKSELIKIMIDIGHRLGSRNYTPGYSGNLSARYGDNIIITTSGSSNAYLTEDDFVEIDYEGKSVNSEKKPSSEKLLHMEFYKVRPDVNFIVHVHPACLCAFASSGRDLMAPVMAENIFYFGGIPLAKYGMPSSKELVDNTAVYFKDYDAVLMENHGVVIGSKTMEDAYQKLEVAEEYARTVIYTEILGGAKLLSEDQKNAVLALRG